MTREVYETLKNKETQDRVNINGIEYIRKDLLKK